MRPTGTSLPLSFAAKAKDIPSSASCHASCSCLLVEGFLEGNVKHLSGRGRQDATYAASRGGDGLR